MSNQVYIVSTIFTDYDGEEHYGYRMFDDYGSAYNNFMDKEEYKGFLENERGLLTHIVNNGTDITDGMIDFIRKYEEEININDTTYKWEEIKEIIS